MIPVSALTRELWAAVDQLTEPSVGKIERDDGSLIDVLRPSLWQQAEIAAGLSGSDQARSSTSERSVTDLDLLAVRALITHYTRRSLALRDQRLRETTPGQLRQLAGYVVGHEPDELWWWSYRYSSWARQLAHLLRLDDRTPTAIRLRNSACPRCDARQVVVDSEDGPVVASAILIDFRDGYVRAAQCSNCGAMWWRGEELRDLAQALGCSPLGV